MVPGRRGDAPAILDRYLLFFTLKKPGITFSIPHFDTDGKLRTVMGIDIELATLCAFLKQLGIGVSGKAIIIDPTAASSPIPATLAARRQPRRRGAAAGRAGRSRC